MTNSNIQTTRSDYSASEWDQRVNLAAALQLAEQQGWTMLVWNHISARVPEADGAFLMNRHGLLYDEMTASNLAKVNVMSSNLIARSNFLKT